MRKTRGEIKDLVSHKTICAASLRQFVPDRRKKGNKSIISLPIAGYHHGSAKFWEVIHKSLTEFLRYV